MTLCGMSVINSKLFSIVHRALSLFESQSTLLSVENQQLKRELLIDLMKFKVSETVTNYDVKLQTIGTTKQHSLIHSNSLTYLLIFAMQARHVLSYQY